jgi:hypothetical protein
MAIGKSALNGLEIGVFVSSGIGTCEILIKVFMFAHEKVSCRSTFEFKSRLLTLKSTIIFRLFGFLPP